MSFIRALRAANKIRLLLDFRTGSIRDLGNDARTTIIGPPPRLSKTGVGTAWNPVTSASYLEVTSLVGLKPSAAGTCFICHMQPRDAYSNVTLVAGSGTNRLHALWTTPTNFSLYSGTGTSSANVLGDFFGKRKKTLGGIWGGPGTSDIFVDGQRYIGSSPLTYTADPTSFVFAYTNLTNNVYSFILFDMDGLVDADVMRVHRELVSGPTTTHRPNRTFMLPYPSKTPSEYAAAGVLFDLRGEVINKTIPDLYSGAYPATVVGQADAAIGGPFEGSVILRAASDYATMPAAVDANVFAGTYTAHGWIVPKSVAAGVGALLSGHAEHYVGRSGAALAHSFRNTVPAQQTTTSGAVLLAGKQTHVAYTVAASPGAVTVGIFVDGVQITSQPYAQTLLAASTSTQINRLPAGTNSFLCAVNNLTYHKNVALSPTQIRVEYIKGARKCLLDSRVHSDGSCPTTLAAIPAGGELANGWKVRSGTWNVVDDVTVLGARGKAWLKCATAGVVSIENESAFGSWYTRIIPNSVEHETLLVASDYLSVSSASQNGYGIHLTAGRVLTFRERTAGVASALITPGVTLTAGIEYEFWVTRRYDGLFNWYIKGGVYTTWTSLGAATDTTTTSSKYAVQYGAGANAQSGGVVQYLGEMTPYEAIGFGAIKGVKPEPFWTVTTTDLTQNWAVSTIISTTAYVIDWGDGQQNWYTGNQAPTHTYVAAGTYTVKFSISAPSQLFLLQANGNSLVGTMPARLAEATGLDTLYLYTNSISGSIPSLTTLAALRQFYIQTNSVSGTIPALSSNPLLQQFVCSNNALVGQIPSITLNTALSGFNLSSNNLTTYTASTIATTCTNFQLQGNALIQASVDQILADFETNVAARPAVGTINLSGGTNAAPSAAGLASKAAILAAKPGWTITHN